jgi:putative tryptophan/tyrosine transport system substrate-binding protein
MRRREFVTGIVGSAAAWPAAARAQQARKLPTIGFLGAGTPSTWKSFIAGFQNRLQELGWIQGRTVALQVRWAEGHTDRYSSAATEFVRIPVDVIVAPGSAGAAIKQATSSIPVVLCPASDPVGSGLVASLSRPGGNITALSLQANEVAGKRIEYMQQAAPAVRRVAILFNPDYTAALLEMSQVAAAAGTVGLEPIKLPIRSSQEIAAAIESIKGRDAALYGCIDGVVNANQAQINNLALAARLPTLYSEKEFVESGGFMSYGPNISALFSRAAEVVDKILNGAKPADIPVEQPTTFNLVLNLRVAKTLGIDLPPTLLALADEVIE